MTGPKTYVGIRCDGIVQVTVWHDVNGHRRDYELPLRLDLRNHSPTGFEWGYAGSGPAQLALAILADLMGDEFALRFYQAFKFGVICSLKKDCNFVLRSTPDCELGRFVAGRLPAWQAEEEGAIHVPPV